MYYRVGNKNEKILEATSVEIAMESHGFKSVEDLLEAVCAKTTEDAETDSMFWKDDGHFGPGLYYAGVCCSDSLEDLASYFDVGTLGVNHLNDSVIFVFEGDWVDSCNDGDVVNPTKLIEILDVDILETI